jgi:hypothetical protein
LQAIKRVAVARSWRFCVVTLLSILSIWSKRYTPIKIVSVFISLRCDIYSIHSTVILLIYSVITGERILIHLQVYCWRRYDYIDNEGLLLFASVELLDWKMSLEVDGLRLRDCLVFTMFLTSLRGLVLLDWLRSIVRSLVANGAGFLNISLIQIKNNSIYPPLI